MPLRLQEILVRARDTLSDHNAERWTDARLVRLADDAQRAIAVFAGLLRARAAIPLVTSQVEYTLPVDAHQITRVLNEFKQSVTLMSHDQADAVFGINWEQQLGSPVKAVIYDKLNGGTFRVYPVPAEVAVQQVGTPPNQVYGLVSSGVIQAQSFSSPFGIATGFEVTAVTELTVYYLGNPTALVASTDLLQFNQVFDRAIKFYITVMALRDDKDVQNRQIGNEELGFFQTELRRAMSDGMLDSTAAGTNYDVSYEKVI